MKKLLLFLLTLFYSSTLLLSRPNPSLAGCFPPNPWTGNCDSGVVCTNGQCCDLLSQCTIPIPPNQTFVCSWNGTSCIVGAQNCDPSISSPNPSLCAANTTSSSCNGQNYACSSGAAPSVPSTSIDLCDTPSGPDTGVPTALGCLNITGKETVSQILGWAVGVGGGIAFLLIVYSGFQMATASGDPKRVKASQELLTAALSGLFLIILSVMLLNLIGVNILNLPGFSL